MNKTLLSILVLFLTFLSYPALAADIGSYATIVHEGQPVAELAGSEVRIIPGWMSLLPPVIAIGLALILRSVVPALFAGLWVGVIVIRGFTPSDMFLALLDTFQVMVLKVLANEDHAAILLFSAMIGGMVGIISKNGGMQGIANSVIRWAHTPRRGQLSVWFLGLAVFFDDYTNTLAVGNSVRPITDRLRISREKVAYIVDSTAAPIACIAVITTWIGYELGLISEVFSSIEGADEAAYSIFLNSIPYSFYPLLTIFFVFLIAWTGRDYGPMLNAEIRSYSATGEIIDDGDAMLDNIVEEHIPARAINAIAPVVSLVVSCIGGLYFTGEGDSVREWLSTGDVYKALMWGSMISAAVAVLLSLAQRLMSVERLVSAWTNGVTSMVPPLIILVLAWSLAEVTGILGTAEYLVALAGDALPPQIVPAVAFVLSAAAAFATGSSWGVMALMLPLVLPLAWSTLLADGGVTADNMHIIYSTLASVLAGAIWGDHCSPISDTTVLSSLATRCNHIEHVRTQIPYALTVGGVALLLGTIPTAFGVPWWLALLVAALVLVGIVRFFGRFSYDQARPPPIVQ